MSSDQGEPVASGKENSVICGQKPNGLNSPPPLTGSSNNSSGSMSLSNIRLSQTTDGQPHFLLSQNTMALVLESLKDNIGENLVSRASQSPAQAVQTRSMSGQLERPSINSTPVFVAPVPLPAVGTDLLAAQSQPPPPPFGPDAQFTFAVPGFPPLSSSPLAHYQAMFSHHAIHEATGIATLPQLPQLVRLDNQPGLPSPVAIQPLEGARAGILPSISPITAAISKPDVPISTPYPGNYGFSVFIPEPKHTESKKTMAYTYSMVLRKLFIKIQTWCPINFQCTIPTASPPAGCIVRAMVAFSRPQDVSEVVRRCNNHALNDEHSARYHWVRAHNPDCRYEVDPVSGRYSVVVPWEPPSEDSGYMAGLYQFVCYNSCVKRPTVVIFTLEYCNAILGRQVVELRTCACPGRDKENEENQSESVKKKKRGRPDAQPCQTDSPSKMATSSRAGNSKTRPRCASSSTVLPMDESDSDDESAVFTLKIRGRKMYNFMVAMKEQLEMAQEYRKLMAGGKTPKHTDQSGLEDEDMEDGDMEEEQE